MSQAPEHRPRKHQPKPPKLRSACNQCNAAKVKCSGERDGCARCKTLQTNCVYVESRVGKVQGSRLRQKSLGVQNTPKSPAMMGQQTANIVPNLIDPRLTPNTPSRHTFSHPAQHTNSWSESWEPVDDWASSAPMLDETFSNLNNILGEEDLRLSPNTPTNGGQAEDGPGHANADAGIMNCNLSGVMDVSSPSDTCSVSPSRRQVDTPPSPTNISPDLGFGLPTPHSFSVSTPNSTQKPQQAPGPQSEMGEKELARLDSKCALACTHIIATLESYLLLELKALDLILDATRKATNEVEKLVQLQKQSRCGRCIILFTVALSQIIDLLHIGTKQLPDGGTGFEDKLIPGMQLAFMPSLGFSAFSFAAEEQSSLRLSLIRRECRHVGKILVSVEALAEKVLMEQKTICLKSLKKRLEGMCDLNHPGNDIATP